LKRNKALRFLIELAIYTVDFISIQEVDLCVKQKMLQDLTGRIYRAIRVFAGKAGVSKLYCHSNIHAFTGCIEPITGSIAVSGGIDLLNNTF